MSLPANPNNPSNVNDDILIINYCKSNPTNNKCGCVIPPDFINSSTNKNYTPYYCWYAPCKSSESYLTTALKYDMSYCNINQCSITIDQITFSGGLIEIINECSSQISTTKLLSQRSFPNLDTLYKYSIPIVGIIIIIPICIVLLLLFIY